MFQIPAGFDPLPLSDFEQEMKESGDSKGEFIYDATNSLFVVRSVL
jgi:hypothetical protein